MSGMRKNPYILELKKLVKQAVKMVGFGDIN